MPYRSRAQVRYFHSQLPQLAAKWDAHTSDFKKLPEKVKKTDKDKDEKAEKKAFVLAFLSKCASEGLTTPTQIADAAEKLAGVAEALGGLTGTMALGGAAGLAIPTALGYVGGRTIAGAGNEMDKDDADSLRVRAEANAYRRRAAEARLGAQVRKIVASDPRKYVVLS